MFNAEVEDHSLNLPAIRFLEVRIYRVNRLIALVGSRIKLIVNTDDEDLPPIFWSKSVINGRVLIEIEALQYKSKSSSLLQKADLPCHLASNPAAFPPFEGISVSTSDD